MERAKAVSLESRARVRRILGWMGAFLWCPIGLVGLEDAISSRGPAEDYVYSAISLALGALHVWLIVSGYRRRTLARRARQISDVMEGTDSLPVIASRLGHPEARLIRDAKDMCHLGLFDGYVDHVDKRLVLRGGAPLPAVNVCPSCGARSRTADRVCPFCGCPLDAPARDGDPAFRDKG